MISSFFLLNLVKWNSPNLKDKKVGSKNIHLKPVDTFGISNIFFSEPAPTVVEAGKTYGITLTICGTFENNVYIHYKQSGEEGNSKIYEDPVPSTNQSASRQFTFPQDPPSQDITYIFWLSHSNTPATNPGDSDSASKDFSVTVKTPPKPTINNVPSDSIFTENFDITLNIKAQSTGICYYKIDEGNEQEQPYSGSESSYSATVTVDVSSLTYAQNQHTVTFLRCTDNDKLSGDFPSENNQFQFNIKHQPSISAVNIQNSPVTTNTVQFTITYSDSDTGKPLRLYISNQDNIDSASSLGDQFDSGSTPAEFSYKFIPNNDHDAQEFTYYLWLKDEDSSTSTTNKQSESQSLVFTYNKAPTMDSFTAPDVHAYKNGVEASFTIGVTDDSTGKVVFYLNDINTPILELDYAKGTSTADYKLQIDSTNFPYKSDDYTISIQLKDQYQVSSDALHTFNFKVRNPPAISDLSILQNVYQLGKTDPVQVRFTLTDSDSTKDINIFQKIGDSEKQIDSITGSHESTITREFNLDLQGITAGDYQIYIYASDTDTPPTSNSKSAEVNPVSLTVAPQMGLTLNNIKEFYINPVQIQSTVTLTNLNEGGKFDTKILKGTTVQHSEMDDTYSTTSDPTIDFQVPNDLAAGEYTLQVQAIGDHTYSDIVSKSFRVIIQTSISLTLEDLNEYSEDTDNIPIEGKVSGSGYITLTVQLDEQTQEGITTTISLGDGTKNQEITGLSIPTSSLQKGHQYTLKVIATSSFDSGDYKENNDEFKFIIIRKPILSNVQFEPSIYAIGDETSPRLKGRVSQLYSMDVTKFYIHYRKSDQAPYEHYQLTSTNQQGEFDIPISFNTAGTYTYTVICNDNSDPEASTYAKSDPSNPQIIVTQRPTLTGSFSTSTYYSSNDANSKIKVTYEANDDSSYSVIFEVNSTEVKTITDQTGHTSGSDVEIPIQSFTYNGGHEYQLKVYAKDQHEFTSDSPITKSFKIMNQPSISINIDNPYPRRQDSICATCTLNDIDNEKPLNLFYQLVQNDNVIRKEKIASNHQSNGQANQTVTVTPITIQANDAFGVSKLKFYMSYLDDLDLQSTNSYANSPVVEKDITITMNPEFEITNQNKFYKTDATQASVSVSYKGLGDLKFKQVTESTETDINVQVPASETDSTLTFMIDIPSGSTYGKKDVTIKLHSSHGYDATKTLSYTILNQPTLANVSVLPENVISGKTVKVTGTVTDADLDGSLQNKKKSYLHIISATSNINFKKEITTTTFSINEEFTVPMPNEASDEAQTEFKIFVSNNEDPNAQVAPEWAKSSETTKQINIIKRPTVVITSIAAEYYEKGASITVAGTFKTNTDATFTYYFDSNEPKNLGTVPKATAHFSYEISIPDTLTHGKHTLNIVVADKHSYTSVPATLNFTIWNKPKLLSASLAEEKYKAGQLIVISGKVHDNDKDDKLQFYVAFNDREATNAYEHTSSGAEEEFSFNVTTPSNITAGDVNVTIYVVDQDKLESEKLNSTFNLYVKEDKTSEKEGNSDKKKTTIIVVVVIIVCVILIIIVAVIIAKKLKNRKDESSSFSGDSQRMPEYELKNEETIITGGAPQSNVTMDNPLFLSTNTDRNNPFNDTDDAGADSDDHGEDLKENEIVFM
ncbi:hypothetical protein TVAG_174500 [Trichomonas vaginalis G3]|uniref:Bap-like n=1 Tax=Trichomonas vaginalis (strain ATCC PRA-98 / G3) TaxID=412133 RepID=A2EJZ7_TRIV3|nr:hypothetical protein TVAGG3_0974610 [Trichomonas vaginalis G3]EAY06981.1 hypothetical protein TVAG_174500 [Trichomonas vaginalis G3]KAI5488839.1 hypothetical protein TVAGG3_0974610 [Trichomonas vaginalis G3]|eukprot:XP_001319204.1 hypothetical protein [Trichomonas vaginalis G3]